MSRLARGLLSYTHPSRLPRRGGRVCMCAHYRHWHKLRWRLFSHGVSQSSTQGVKGRGDPNLVDCSQSAREDSGGFVVIPDFVTPEEEQRLCQDISRTLRGRRYQYDHWDKAIEGYRETEKSQWWEENWVVIDRLRTVTTTSLPGQTLTPLPAVHVLELAADGYIKPHIDSVKFCGEVIAGISLLSSSVMELQHEEDSERWIHALLPRFSLYIMQGAARYKYTHAIPHGKDSFFKGQPVPRDKRISVICRTLP